ncbi:hypothetical protein GUITHDRAFT_106187 [Guillardia theta CCMP2712]|uniref:Uncharacterized protein n=1 Tax=Guillardia theta (strain CCMP2712) TaxID=905079 RepID=L1JJ38_GUITC|nr:hypothetical protein GUITHDRAFT_106187 [Guillardia theta CCMP2712]EKX48110.1 hypothetical protein GUITHDRAFT_106187 [Guillardia theta CCMP2712]|eukprot:XP_005835090.1 hypothetical protein GUITHDRAFT_106187 [Guillardia theta CCMP2712]
MSETGIGQNSYSSFIGSQNQVHGYSMPSSRRKVSARCASLLGTTLKRRIQRTERELIPQVFRFEDPFSSSPQLLINRLPTTYTESNQDILESFVYPESMDSQDQYLANYSPTYYDNGVVTSPSDGSKPSSPSSVGSYDSVPSPQAVSRKELNRSRKNAAGVSWWQDMVEAQSGFPVAERNCKKSRNLPSVARNDPAPSDTFAVEGLSPDMDSQGILLHGVKSGIPVAAKLLESYKRRQLILKNLLSKHPDTSAIWTKEEIEEFDGAVPTYEFNNLAFPSQFELEKMSATTRDLWKCFIEQHSKLRSVESLSSEKEATTNTVVERSPCDVQNEVIDSGKNFEAIKDVNAATSVDESNNFAWSSEPVDSQFISETNPVFEDEDLSLLWECNNVNDPALAGM